MSELFCEVCGDNCVAVYPCKFVFHDQLDVDLNVCPACMKHGKLVLDLPRRRFVCIVLSNLKKKRISDSWRKRIK